MKKIQKTFSLLHLLKKIPERKKFEIGSSLIRSLRKPRKINEIMNPMIGLIREIKDLK